MDPSLTHIHICRTGACHSGRVTASRQDAGQQGALVTPPPTLRAPLGRLPAWASGRDLTAVAVVASSRLHMEGTV